MRLASYPGFPYDPGTKDIHVPGMSHVSISNFRSKQQLGQIMFLHVVLASPYSSYAASCNQGSWPAAN